jgi:HSP90 family molecular chaperone
MNIAVCLFVNNYLKPKKTDLWPVSLLAPQRTFPLVIMGRNAGEATRFVLWFIASKLPIKYINYSEDTNMKLYLYYLFIIDWSQKCLKMPLLD